MRFCRSVVNSSSYVAFEVASDRVISEDAVRVLQIGDHVAFAVADGAGGLSGGARAAQLVVEGFERAIEKAAVDQLTSDMLCALLLELDAQIQRDRDAGESTAVVGLLRDRRLVGASVGDSEVWRVPHVGSHEVLTSGQQKPRLGSGRATPVGFHSNVGDALVLAATDGLFHAVSSTTICSLLRDEPSPKKLIAAARSKSGKLYDDIGIVLVSSS